MPRLIRKFFFTKIHQLLPVRKKMAYRAVLVSLALTIQLAGGVGSTQRELLRAEKLLAALALPAMTLPVLTPHAVAEFLKLFTFI
jgi:hypothetical protein